MQPGDLITPGGPPAPTPEVPTPPQPPEQSQAAPPAPVQPEAPAQTAPEPEAPPQSTWAYSNTDQDTSQPTTPSANPEITWTASEYIAHEKSAGWYLMLAVAAALAAGLAFLFTGDLVTVGIIPIVAIIFGIFASRKPEVLTYQIDQSGVTIGRKHYPYESFRSFAIQEEGAIDSIFLVPMQRFMPGLSIYFPPDQEDPIVDTLGNYLPHEERPPDVVDKLMRKVRF